MPQEPVIPPPESDDVKEVYAFHGLAMYHGQCLEKNVLNLLVILCLTKTTHVTAITIDGLYDKNGCRTLGQLLKETRKHVTFDNHLTEIAESALARRNHIAHEFFYQHCEAFITATGRAKMIVELRDHALLLVDVNRAIEDIFFSFTTKFGLTRDKIGEMYDATIAELHAADADS